MVADITVRGDANSFPAFGIFVFRLQTVRAYTIRRTITQATAMTMTIAIVEIRVSVAGTTEFCAVEVGMGVGWGPRRTVVVVMISADTGDIADEEDGVSEDATCAIENLQTEVCVVTMNWELFLSMAI
jgi:hypothetical protein